LNNRNVSDLFKNIFSKILSKKSPNLLYHLILKKIINIYFKDVAFNPCSHVETIKLALFFEDLWIKKYFFCSTSLLKAPNCLKSLKLAWRFVLTFIKIRSHRKNFSNSDSVEQKNILKHLKSSFQWVLSLFKIAGF
jgi:hypothetical protein